VVGMPVDTTGVFNHLRAGKQGVVDPRQQGVDWISDGERRCGLTTIHGSSELPKRVICLSYAVVRANRERPAEQHATVLESSSANGWIKSDNAVRFGFIGPVGLVLGGVGGLHAGDAARAEWD